MLNKNFCETENIGFLAGFDFVDLCLLGETGTGKTHTAELIHELSPRAAEPLIAVNCAELNPSIIEAELFGAEKGAYTGAVATKCGKFEAASGGTIFLDEIGELPANLQAKLLKVVEKKEITRVGGTRPRPVNVRIIYATHRDLTVFREDFRYRIGAHAIFIKPLRERRDEIVPLASAFIADFSRKSGREILADSRALSLLETAEWPGNVRELRSFIEQICLRAVFEARTAKREPSTIVLSTEMICRELPVPARAALRAEDDSLRVNLETFAAGDRLDRYIESVERQLVKGALLAHNNNQSRAAKHLGISRGGLIKKLKRMTH